MKPPDHARSQRTGALVRFGPQPDFADYAHDAVGMTEAWIVAIKEAEPDIPEPPLDLEALLDVLLDTWTGAPEADWADGEDAYMVRGEVVLRRAGEEAALSYYQDLAANEELGKDLRSLAWNEAAGLHAQRGEIALVLHAWDQSGSLQESPDQVLLLQSFYLSLAHEMRDEGWQRLERLAAIPADDRLPHIAPDDLFQELAGFVSDRAAAEAWWDASATWWPRWRELATDLRRVDLESPLAESQPWWVLENFSNELQRALKRKNPRRRREAVTTLLEEILTLTRWHPSTASAALDMLENHAPGALPKRAMALAEVAAAIREAHQLPKLPEKQDP